MLLRLAGEQLVELNWSAAATIRVAVVDFELAGRDFGVILLFWKPIARCTSRQCQ